MKKQNNQKGYRHSSISQFVKPLVSEVYYFKNFRLSQQHHGIKGLKK